MEDSPTAALARYIAGSARTALPECILEHARCHVLDTVASIVACAHLEPACVARRHALSHGGQGGPASILPAAGQTSLVQAAFANAIADQVAGETVILVCRTAADGDIARALIDPCVEIVVEPFGDISADLIVERQ